MLSMDFEIVSYEIDSTPLRVGIVTITGANWLVIAKQKKQLSKDICNEKGFENGSILIRGVYAL